MRIQIELLAENQREIERGASWLELEWPEWYGPSGEGDASLDARHYANREKLPLGLIAIQDSVACGFAAVKNDGITGYEDRGPWIGAAVVPRDFRNQGIGAALLKSLEKRCAILGYSKIYAGTKGASALLLRGGWQELEASLHNGEQINVFQKAI